jgi:hypothetical protein
MAWRLAQQSMKQYKFIKRKKEEQLQKKRCCDDKGSARALGLALMSLLNLAMCEEICGIPGGHM